MDVEEAAEATAKARQEARRALDAWAEAAMTEAQVHRKEGGRGEDNAREAEAEAAVARAAKADASAAEEAWRGVPEGKTAWQQIAKLERRNASLWGWGE